MSPVSLRRLSSAVCLLASALGLAGCTLIPEPRPDPTRFYVLTGPAPAALAAAEGTNNSTTATDGLRIGLEAVEVAPYLKGRSMVVRRGANELVFNEYARWAEPLDAAIASRVRAELLSSPRVARVLVYPFPFDAARDCTVRIRVAQCEGAEPQPAGGGFVTRFVATIEVTTGGEAPAHVTRRVFTAPETAWNGKDYGALAAALGDAVGALAQEVAAALPAK